MKKIVIFFYILVAIRASAESETSEHRVKGSLIIVPAISYFIPGFGSALESDYLRTASFLGYAVAGGSIVSNTQNRIDEFRNSDSLNFHHYRDLQAEQNTGYRMIHHSMMLSTYDSFQSRVKAYQEEGQYTFLPKDQNVNSLLLAPFKFGYMKRWTTVIPFILAIGIGASVLNEHPRPGQFQLRPIDAVASSYSSYVAGTGEEAFFRGWVYPILFQNTQSHLISNTVQGLAFGYAHGPQPYFQLAAGLYFGWLSNRNNFDIGEPIFVHAWWDFWIIAAEYVRSRSFTRDYNIQLPAASFLF